MSTTYAQRQKTAQKVADSKAASLFDSSSQSESLQRKADMANNAAQRAEAPRPNNTGMPDNLKSGIESLSGFSMDDVRVHYNSSKPATVQALAYTQGTDIHVAPGQEKHLPHEAWHVAQQMAGRVSPTTNINGMPVNDNAALEHEADVMGEKAVDHRYENESIKKQTISKNNLQRRAHVLQLLGNWEKVYDNLYRWSSIRNGVQWYLDDKKNMWYFIPDIEEVPEKLRPGYLYYESERKKRADWEKLHKEWADWEKLHKEWADSELEKYYYHISSEGIPKDKEIDPKYVIHTPGSRATRGDDLGPGFYMGDSDCLKYYYGQNFLNTSPIHIYYIEKGLIDTKLGSGLKDFTQKNPYDLEPNDLFNIAMQLGFRYTDEDDVYNHQRPLDLLAEEETEELDKQKKKELDEQKMKEFGEYVKKIYGDGKKANDIIKFFNEAHNSTIWKGYLNDTDRTFFSRTEMIALFREFCYTRKIPMKVMSKLTQELIIKFPEKIKYNEDFFNESNKIIQNTLSEFSQNTLLPKFPVQDYKIFLNRNLHFKYNYVELEEEEKKVKPKQITIRDGKENEGLLKQIKDQKYMFFAKDIECAKDKPTNLEEELKKALKDEKARREQKKKTI